MPKIGGINYNLDTTAITATVEINSDFLGAANIPATVTDNGTTYAVVAIGANAFEGCSGLTSVTIPASVQSIGDSAFASCLNLTSVTIGSGVTSIGGLAFFYTTKLISVSFLGDAPTVGARVFFNSPATIYYTSGKLRWEATFAEKTTVAVSVKHNYTVYFSK